MAYTTHDIRNLALVGHAGAGKTQLAEALLHAGGAINNQGSIERGDTTSDFDSREQQLQHSLTPTFCHLDHGGIHVNLVDTPGHRDFIGRSLSVLPAVETVAVVVNAQTGTDTVTQQLMDITGERGLCRMIIINKIDAPDVNLAGVLDDVQTTFGPQCLPINLPCDNGASVMDCFFHADGAQPDFSTVEAAHSQMVDQVVEVDEDLMELYLEQGEELSPEQLHDPFEQALREGHLIPVCFVSARTGAGVVELLEVLERLMPNPDEGNPPAFLKGEGGEAEPVVVSPDPQAHAIAHVVKVDVDPFKGRLGVVRVHQGTLRVGAQVYVGEARKPIKITHLLKLNGKTHTEVDSVIAGDICAIPRADEVFFDGVLHDSHDEDHFHVRSVELPPPMYGLAIKSSNDADARKIADGLHTLQAEDPSLHVEHNAALNETVLRGVGDLHLRIAIEEVQEQYNVELETSLPSIPYRETITAKSEGHSRHKKQTGGAGQFGEVFLRVEPLPRGAGFEFENQVVGGAIPFQFIPAVEKGIREVLHGGAVAGYELQDVKAIVYDGKHHAVDSKEIAFVAAGKKAFLDAIGNARPIVMEPVVNVSVTVPDHCMGDVTGDLSAMRGMVNGTTALPNNRLEISGQAPLQELQSYHSRLKSLSGGEGSYTLDFSHYGAVPAQMQKELQQAYRPQEED